LDQQRTAHRASQRSRAGAQFLFRANRHCVARGQIEATALELLPQVGECFSIPLAVKLSPFYGSIADVARAG
jgi:hypothetical protein